jgi:hypothetical protein
VLYFNRFLCSMTNSGWGKYTSTVRNYRFKSKNQYNEIPKNISNKGLRELSKLQAYLNLIQQSILIQFNMMLCWQYSKICQGFLYKQRRCILISYLLVLNEEHMMKTKIVKYVKKHKPVLTGQLSSATCTEFKIMRSKQEWKIIPHSFVTRNRITIGNIWFHVQKYGRIRARTVAKGCTRLSGKIFRIIIHQLSMTQLFTL